MYFFILHLSIADLLTAFLTVLPEFVFELFTAPKFYAGNYGCKLVKYLFMVGPYLSSYTLVMTAVDRYQVILDRAMLFLFEMDFKNDKFGIVSYLQKNLHTEYVYSYFVYIYR